MCKDDSEIDSEHSKKSDISLHSTNPKLCDVKQDNYVLVRFVTKTAEKCYVGQVMEVDEEEELQITFMERIKSCKKETYFGFRMWKMSVHIEWEMWCCFCHSQDAALLRGVPDILDLIVTNFNGTMFFKYQWLVCLQNNFHACLQRLNF